jgi:hypothetical protein
MSSGHSAEFWLFSIVRIWLVDASVCLFTASMAVWHGYPVDRVDPIFLFRYFKGTAGIQKTQAFKLAT